MFASALKSFSSPILSNYNIESQVTATAGVWKIYDAKKKSTGKAVSVFVFERKSLEPPGGALSARNSAASLKRAHGEVCERLKKEASLLARLRHPSILELAEPVEETRVGNLMFATEPVTASLGSLLAASDGKDRSSGPRQGSALPSTDESLELDALEIQKGLLQVAKGLEFLHDSVGLVHANLTPDVIMINAKSDWKISGLAFASPSESSTAPTTVNGIFLSEALNLDARLPRAVQLNLDYTSPDFVMTSRMLPAADLFSLGLVILTIYNKPHQSPLQTSSSISTYKRLFASSSTVPSSRNNFLSKQPLPDLLLSEVLPRLLAYDPQQRISARELKSAKFFDNVLVSAVHFLESFPAKTSQEKSQFLRGLPAIIPQFPVSVLERKVLPSLLEQMKTPELLALTLHCTFKCMQAVPKPGPVFSDHVLPHLREAFFSSPAKKAAPVERDSLKEAGIVVVLDHVIQLAECCSRKDFKDGVLPVVILALESRTSAVVDCALRSIPPCLPVLDFTTIKNDLFPVVATVFTQTTSMGTKLQGLEILRILCGGTNEAAVKDRPLAYDATTQGPAKGSSDFALDKYTVQEKVVPLIKAIKTREPSVMMAALQVFHQVCAIADAEYIALEVMPTVWAFALGPLLKIDQFKEYMTLIHSLVAKVEREHGQKVQELSSSHSNNVARTEVFAFRSSANDDFDETETNGLDFEKLVLGQNMSGTNADSSTARPLDSASAHDLLSNGFTPQQHAPSSNPSNWSTAATLDPHPGTRVPMSALGASESTLASSFSSAASTGPPSSPNHMLDLLSQPLQPMRGNSLTPSTQNQSSVKLASSLHISSANISGPKRAPQGSAPPTATRPNLTFMTTPAARPTSQLSLPQVPTLSPPPSQITTPSLQPLRSHSTQHSRPLAAPLSTASGSVPANSQKSGLDMYESLL